MGYKPTEFVSSHGDWNDLRFPWKLLTLTII